MIQYKISYWGFYINYESFFYAKLLTSISFICFTLGYLIFHKNRNELSEKLGDDRLKTNILGILFASMGLVFFQLYVENFNYLNLFLRDYGSGIETPTIFWLINLAFIKTAPFAIFLTIKLNKNNNSDWMTDVILIVAIVLTTFPSGVPRFMVGIVYLPIVYVYLLKKINSGYFLLLIVSLLLVFPLLEIARSAISTGEYDFHISDYLIGNFSDGHLDAFQGILLTLNESPDYGFQIIGAALFFIPRFFWDTKPIGLGQLLAEKNELVFTNISMPLIGEFFYAFNTIGVAIGYLIIGILFSWLDKANIRHPSSIYLALVPLMMIVMRGDLFTGLSFLTGIILSIKFWGFLTNKFLLVKDNASSE